MKKIMKKPLCVILFLLSGLLPFHAAPSYTMRSCAPMRSWYASPASSASAYPRIGYTTAPAVSYGGRGVRTASPYSPYSVMTRSYAVSSSPYAVTQTAASAASYAPQGRGPRKVLDTGDGEYNGEYYEGQWWNASEEDWVDEPFDGCKKIVGGLTYEYQNKTWVLIANQADPDAPIGDTPWFWMLLLAAGYAALKMSLRDIKELKS
jgi:hypothetical protein